jgi:hypothetical protein
MKQPYWQLLVVGVVLNCLGFVLSTLWTAEKGYVIESIAGVVWLNILLVLGAMYGRRWCVYVLAGVTLVGGVAQAATLEPRRFILSVLWLGAAAAFCCLPRSDAKRPIARPDLAPPVGLAQHAGQHRPQRPVLLALN